MQDIAAATMAIPFPGATATCIPPLVEDPPPSGGMLGSADKLVVAFAVIAGLLGKTVLRNC